eukprot:c51809_g1_i1 orf=186-341(+)
MLKNLCSLFISNQINKTISNPWYYKKLFQTVLAICNSSRRTPFTSETAQIP